MRQKSKALTYTIDFGTTFSGSCYASTYDKETKDLNIIQNDTKFIQTAVLDREEIINIDQWNEDKGSKTPTVVVYDEHMHLSHWGKAATTHIATKKSPQDIVLEKFKLKLPKSVSQKGAVLVSGNTEQDDEEANMRATIDFFRVLYEHIFSQINTHRPSSKIEFTKDDIRFVITVPAIWNDVERTIMRNVAVSAGLISEKDNESRLTIISESLAATLYCEREKAENNIQIGTSYIICDAGGETVDIASFAATEAFEGNKSFPRCQLTADTGERCGSTHLDEKMKELLMRVLFRPNNMSIYHSDEQKEEFGKLGFIDYTKEERKGLDIIVAELMKQFNGDYGFKYTFPAPHMEFTSEVEYSSDDNADSDRFCSESGSSDDGEDEADEIILEDGPYGEKVTTFEINTRNAIDKIRFLPVSEARYVKDPTSEIGVMLLQVSYETMRNLVFDPVISTAIKLLEKQIDKIKEPVVATFLVGGFGRNPYLHYRIQDKFKIEQDGKVIGYKCGDLSDDEKGNLAAMRGALYYGLDQSRQRKQTEMIPIKISSEAPDQTICIEFNQDSLLYSCNALDPKSLSSKNVKTILLETTFCARKNGEDLDRHFCSGFSLLLERLQESNDVTDVKKVRYCVLLDPFLAHIKHSRKRIRQAAVNSTLIDENDGEDRLLFINYDDAVALSFQKTCRALLDQNDNCYHMIIIVGDGFVEVSTYQHAILYDSHKSRAVDNFRKLMSSVVSFDILQKLTTQLDSLTATRAVTIRCSSVDSHDRYNKSYFQDLRKYISKFLKTCHLAGRGSSHEFAINQDGCCKASVPSKQLWELVFIPVFIDFMKIVYDSIFDNILIRSTQYKSIHVVGDLVETPKETSRIFEQYIVKNLADMWKVDRSIIQITKDNAMDGAALFAAKPEIHNERFARATYAVAIEAVEKRPFEAVVKEQIHGLTQIGAPYTKIYTLESQNAIPSSQAVQLFYEDTSDRLATTTSQNVCVDDAYLFIVKGERFSEKEHLQGGIRNRFYAMEECIVYADIYSTLEETDNRDLQSLPKSKLQRGHRFEIYLKNNNRSKGRQPIYFEIHLYTKSNEILFDVQLYPKVNSGYLQFRLPHKILVSNVLEDEALLMIP